MPKLTQQVVDRATAPATGQRFLRDARVRGLALRVTIGGAKAWLWEGHVRGRVRRITLRRHRAMSLPVARDQALAVAAAVARGEDPAAARARERGQLTFGGLADLYFERHARPRERVGQAGRDCLTSHARPSRSCMLASVAIAGTTRPTGGWPCSQPRSRLGTLLRRQPGHRHPGVPRRATRLLPGFLTCSAQPWPPSLKSRTAGGARISAWPCCSARGGRLLRVQWPELDFSARAWRLPTPKAGRSHLLPLPTPAVEILESLPSRGQSECVFPSPTSRSGRLEEPKKAWQRILERANTKAVRIHDLRRTLGSWLAASGYELPMIGRVLNHSQPSAAAAYARLDLEPVRRALAANPQAMLEVERSTAAESAKTIPGSVDHGGRSPDRRSRMFAPHVLQGRLAPTPVNPACRMRLGRRCR